MAKQKVISFEELKENFCLETTKQRFLDFKPAKNNLDNYFKNTEGSRFTATCRFCIDSV